MDLLVVAEDRADAETLGERLLGLCLADDVICQSQAEWQDRRQGRDPHWRGIVRDAVLPRLWLPLDADGAMTPRLEAWLRQAPSDLAMGLEA